MCEAGDGALKIKLLKKGFLLPNYHYPCDFELDSFDTSPYLVEEKRTHPYFTIHILLNNWKLCLYINTSHIFLGKSHFIFKHRKRLSRKFYAQTNFVFVCKTTGYCAIIIGKDGDIKSFHRFIRVFENKCMTMRRRNGNFKDIHLQCFIFQTFFSEHSCSILVYNRYNAHTLKIYMKNTQNINTGLTKYILTQFQSIELQILYKCLYNNPGMS